MRAILVGRYLLRINPVILLGACSGAGTNTASLRAIQEEAGSKLAKANDLGVEVIDEAEFLKRVGRA